MTRALRIAVGGIASLALLGCSTMSSKPNSLGSLNRPSPLDPPSFTAKVGTAITGSTTKVANWVATGSTDGKKATSSSSEGKRTKRTGVDVHLSLAQLREASGDFERAEEQYQKALELEPNNLGALLGTARLKDRQGDLPNATRIYQRAVAKHPNEAGAYNDLGLCYFRRGMLRESADMLSKAVQLQPNKKLYRNNLATVLVPMGRANEAFAQLAAVHPPAVAHYNLGFLLAGANNPQLALANFQRAATIDPSMTSAQEWVEQLTPAGGMMPPPMTYAVASDAFRQPPHVTQPRPVVTAPALTAAAPAPGAQPQYLQARTSNAPPMTVENPAAQAMQYPGRHSKLAQSRGADLPPIPDEVD